MHDRSGPKTSTPGLRSATTSRSASIGCGLQTRRRSTRHRQRVSELRRLAELVLKLVSLQVAVPDEGPARRQDLGDVHDDERLAALDGRVDCEDGRVLRERDVERGEEHRPPGARRRRCQRPSRGPLRRSVSTLLGVELPAWCVARRAAVPAPPVRQEHEQPDHHREREQQDEAWRSRRRSAGRTRQARSPQPRAPRACGAACAAADRRTPRPESAACSTSVRSARTSNARRTATRFISPHSHVIVIGGRRHAIDCRPTVAGAPLKVLGQGVTFARAAQHRRRLRTNEEVERG